VRERRKEDRLRNSKKGGVPAVFSSLPRSRKKKRRPGCCGPITKKKKKGTHHQFGAGTEKKEEGRARWRKSEKGKRGDVCLTSFCAEVERKDGG